MRIGYLDCFAGVAGDMWVGALLDLGQPLEPLAAAVASLGLPGVAVRQERVLRQGLAGTRFVVEGAAVGEGHGHGHPPRAPHDPHAHHDHLRHQHQQRHQHHQRHHQHHRHLPEILDLLDRADLPEPARVRARQVFQVLGEAEAQVHDQAIDEVHFHEVGAEDTIVDIVCAVLGTHLLGIDRLYSSAVVTGTGTVHCEHGEMPVPAPGTLGSLFGIPVRSGQIPFECTTPTGAALLKVLVNEFEPDVIWVPERTGYGAGTRDVEGHPNLLRLTVGESRDAGPASTLTEISCNLDTATGEHLAWVLDGMFARGAADAFAIPIVMKKGRPAYQLTALVDRSCQDKVVEFLLEDSSTLGVRMHRVERQVLDRWQETVTTDLGPVSCKAARLPSGTIVRRPEEGEVRRLAMEHAIGRSEVLARLLKQL